MSNDLTTFQQVQEKIKESVKVQFFNMLPDEAFQAMIEKEIAAFFEVQGAEFTIKRGSSSYDHAKLVAEVSPFRIMVWEQVKTLTTARMKDVLESEEFRQACMGAGQESQLKDCALSRYDALAVAMAGVFFQRVMGEAMFQAKNDVYNSLQSAGINVNRIY
ncbi:hypothetical protein [Flavobacterium sp.]|jgi:hypothetical protein|uniref:hypothetical protein n=1 Tax=Flavobacterium sp. TaxID=239 RepID=UPI0037BEDECC